MEREKEEELEDLKQCLGCVWCPKTPMCFPNGGEHPGFVPKSLYY